MNRWSGWLALALLIAPAAWSQPKPAQQTEAAIFAGGCFWCVESDFDKVDGVLSTTSGYVGGTGTYRPVGLGTPRPSGSSSIPRASATRSCSKNSGRRSTRR